MCYVFTSAHLPLLGKFGRDPFSSLSEIAGERRAPRTGPRVGTNLPPFLGLGLADFVRFHHPVQNLSGQNQTSLLFEQFPRLVAPLDVAWAGPAQK